MAFRTAVLRLHLLPIPLRPAHALIPRQCTRTQQRKLTQSRRLFYASSPSQQRILVPNQPTEPTYNPIPRQVPQPNRLIRAGFFALGLALAFSTGWMLATNPTVVTAMAVATQPTDEKTLELWNPDPDSPAGKIEAQLQQLALVRQLNAQGDKWQASRPHLKIPPSLRASSFTGGHLLQEDKLTVPPLVYVDGQGKELVCFVYVGNKVCGHPGMVHGGLLATLMDEGLARTCFAQLPSKVGVTANLNINYRAPCRAGQFVVLKGETIKVEGRKAYVKGRIEAVTPDGSSGKVLVDGEALFIEPKGYATRLMRITQ